MYYNIMEYVNWGDMCDIHKKIMGRNRYECCYQ